jgi:hypothetical protein
MSTDFDYSAHTPVDNTGSEYSIFRSGYKNIRFAMSPTGTYPINESDMANLPGIAFRLYGDVSLWRILLAYNGFEDAIQEVVPGVILQVPSKSDVIKYISAQQASQSASFTI